MLENVLLCSCGGSSVQSSVTNRFAEMCVTDLFFCIKICDGARDLEDAVIGAR